MLHQIAIAQEGCLPYGNCRETRLIDE